MTTKNKNTNKTKNKPFFRFLERVARGICGKQKFVGIENIPDEPSIIVGNHAQIYGPWVNQLFFPHKKRIWVIGHMLHRKEVPEYAFQDFWGYKPKWTHWFYRMLAHLIAPICVYIHKNADTIGVYKDTRGISTFKNSVQALKDGSHIVIFPECHTGFNEIVNEFQDKFVDLARIFHKDTKKEISFVPMYTAPKIKTVVYGKPTKYDCSVPIEEQRKKIVEYLKNEITTTAKDLPVHTVVPYANISKKKYPKSKTEES